MNSQSPTASEAASPCTRSFARALQAWAIGGAVFFAPGAVILAVLGLVGMGAFGVAFLLPIGCTFFGAWLFYAAGAALRRGEPAAGQIAWAALATWNVLVLLSASVLWSVGKMAVTDWDRFVAEYSRVRAFDGYFLAGAVLHVVVNGLFLIAAAFVRTPPRAETAA